ncbi:unnamed protein product [Penicillium glandicola]
MSGYPSSSSVIRTIGRREVCEVNGRKFSRRFGTQEWTELAYDQASSQAPALPSRPVNIVHSASFLNIYHLAVLTEQQEMVVKQIAEQELPPRAANRQSVKENCQGWTVRVISNLVRLRIVPAAKLQMARSMLQPV